jgi:hypothetical protein
MRDGTGSRCDAGVGSAWQLELGRQRRRNRQCSRSRVELVGLLLVFFFRRFEWWRLEFGEQ